MSTEEGNNQIKRRALCSTAALQQNALGFCSLEPCSRFDVLAVHALDPVSKDRNVVRQRRVDLREFRLHSSERRTLFDSLCTAGGQSVHEELLLLHVHRFNLPLLQHNAV
jgi:hypothetical protein